MESHPPETTPPFVWFVFTDIEGSTTRWERYPTQMPDALAKHDQILIEAMQGHRGEVFKHTGDGIVAAFPDAVLAVRATVAAQHALALEPFAAVEGLAVRMGVHGGPAQSRDGDYFGTTLNRAARIMDMGNGGQIVVSDETRTAVALASAAVEFRELGLHRVKGVSRPLRVHQVCDPTIADITAAMR